MAGGIAHDFNNLLMVVLGNLEFALEDLPSDSETRRSVEKAIQAAKRSSDLSRQMLIYSGSSLYLPKDLDLNELVKKNEDLLNSVIPKTTRLHFDVDKGIPFLRGDSDLIQRVLTNLVTNASEAIGANAGDVTLRTGVMDCDEAYLNRSRLGEKPQPGRFVFLEVTDTGCGMNDETLHRIFDPFSTTKCLGRGLGMAEVMGIVKGHHGAIIVNSEVGEGTTIRVPFPSSQEAQASSVRAMDLAETQTAVLVSPTRRKTIFVVDDEDLVRELCVEWLELLGCNTIVAVDGEECVRVFRERQNEIDLVLLDFVMPKMNGAEAFKELTRIKPDVKVILGSGYTEDVVLQSFLDQRPSVVLHKPYNMEDLKGELDRLLGTAD